MDGVTAFIPVRGGSKSIPLKNIKEFCGKPLVYWTAKAAVDCPVVDRVVVATDSPEIERTVLSFGFDKVSVYHRLPENAVDTASTESVMLEYIDAAGLPPGETFILVQATSPLTESHHFIEALDLFRTGGFDSLLTCVNTKRFFWTADGVSVNYDYRNRPRRQVFPGMFMENGAFYINAVSRIREGRNRLSGRIGVYEMPEYTAIEIDEPDDWHVLEHLMRRHILKEYHPSLRGRIKLFLSDVDGVLTDGSMYYSENGDELKKFNTRDGMAFEQMRKAGIKIGLVTSEETRIVEKRAAKLKMDFLEQGKRDGGKLEAARGIAAKAGVSLAETAYVGDDLNCADLLKACGARFCPSDAAREIKAIPGIVVVDRKGGDGVIRTIWEERFKS